MVVFDGGIFHRSQPITLEHVQEVLKQTLAGQTWLFNATDRFGRYLAI